MSSTGSTRGFVTLDEADAIVTAALGYGRETALPPMTVAVLDGAGQLVAFKKEDNSSLLRPQIAQAKAYGSIALGMGSRGLAERAQSHPAFITSITALAGGNLVPVPGGALILDVAGAVIGAVGVSGGLPDQDESCALHGVAAAGLTAEVGSRHH